ncbi:hypothetical protein CRV24_000066 [Beauveria bassiana]|nr:hypothetical protein CRV24_000066 [Beauveria bassiana]KAH8721421.1 hypothetical protein HC256_001777 [Beauveria bassiana]
MTSMPARGTKIIGLRFRNTANGGLRNIVVMNGIVAFVTTYHKGFKQSGEAKIIHRFLPREVGEILVWYLWLVLPFWQTVLLVDTPGERLTSAFLWPKSVAKKAPAIISSVSETVRPATAEEPRWLSDRLRQALVDCTERHLGQHINPRDWRQVIKSIADRYIGRQAGQVYRRDLSDKGAESGSKSDDDAIDL